MCEKPKSREIDEASDDVKEEHHAITFICKADSWPNMETGQTDGKWHATEKKGPISKNNWQRVQYSLDGEIILAGGKTMYMTPTM